MGSPDSALDRYSVHLVDGIAVYIMDTVEPEEETINVDYFKFLWINKMTVRGAKFAI